MLLKILRNLFKAQRTLLIFMMITSILTAVVGCFIFGVYENYNISLLVGESKTTSVTIKANGWSGYVTTRNDLFEFDVNDKATYDEFKYNNFSSLTKGDIMNVIDEIPEDMYDDIESINCTGTFENDLFVLAPFDFIFKLTDKGPVNLMGESANDYLTDSEYQNGDRHIALTHHFINNQDVSIGTGSLSYTSEFARNITGLNDTIEICGCQYTVSKIIENGTGASFWMIPFTSLPDNAYLNSEVKINFKNPVTYNEYMTLTDIVNNNISNDGFVEDMDLSAVSDLAYYRTIIAITMAVGLLFAVNLAVLYKYVIRCNERKIVVFRICGATRFKCILLFLCQAVIVIAPIFALSLCVFHKWLYPIMIEQFPNAIGCLNLKRYICIFAGYIIVSVFVLLFTLVKNISRKLNFMEASK